MVTSDGTAGVELLKTAPLGKAMRQVGISIRLFSRPLRPV